MAAAPELTIEKEILHHFPEFESVEFIGEGANGRVYKVKRQSQSFALKIYKNKISSQQISYFRKEVAAMACLRHPGIIEIYDSDIKNEYPYMLTELVEGETLDKIIAKGAMPLEKTIKIFTQIVSAITALHRFGFIHRDIKPSNIIITAEDQDVAKLIDYGLISRLDNKDVSQEEAQTVGTIQYASPEQLGLIKAAVDERSDLYSIGLVIYECLAGSAAFQGSNIQEIIALQLKQKVPKFSDEKLFIIQEIIQKLTNKDPEERYSSARQLLADLQNYDAVAKLYSESKFLALSDRKNINSLSLDKIIGRTTELERMRVIRTKLLQKKGQVAFVVGQSGYGKSILVQQVIYESKNHQALVLSGKFEEEGINPLGAIAKSWDDYLKSLEDSITEQNQKEKEAIIQSLGEFPSMMFRLSKRLKNIINKSEDQFPIIEMTEDQFANIIADFFITFVEKMGRPIIFYFDDLQWAPFQSLLIIEKLTTLIQNKSVAMFLTSRAESTETSTIISKLSSLAKCPVETIELGPMNDFEIIDIARKQLGDREIPDDLVHKIIEVAKGHPYTSEQFARFLVDSGALTIRNGSWHVDLNLLSSAELPQNLGDLLTQRMFSLSHIAKNILQVGALIGNEFRKDLAIEIIKTDRIHFVAALQELVVAGLVSIKNEETIKFIHDKVQKVALSQMDSDRVQSGHLQIATLMKKSSSYSISEIADHFIKAEDHADKKEVMESCEKAGIEAYHNNNNELARRFLTACIESPLFDQLNAKPKVDILFSFAHVCRRLGQHKNAVLFFEKAKNLCEDPLYRVRIRSELININLLIDLDLKNAESELRKCYDEVGEVFFLGNLGIILESLRSIFKIALFFIYQKNKPISFEEQLRLKSLALVDRIVVYFEYFSGRSGTKPHVIFRTYYTSIRLGVSQETVFNYSMYLLLFGLLKKKKWFNQLSTRLRMMSTELQDPFLLSPIEANTVVANYLAGDPVAAVQQFKSVMQRSAKWILPEDFFKMNNNLAISFTLRGKYDQLSELLEMALQRTEGVKGDLRRAIIEAFNIMSLLARGKVTEAQQVFSKTFEYIKIHPEQLKHPVGGSVYIFAALWACIENNIFDDDADQLIAAYEALGWKVGKVVFHQKPVYLAICYIRWYQYLNRKSEASHKLFLKAFADLKKSDSNPEVKAHRLIIEASYLRTQSRFVDATQLLDQAMKLSEKIEADACMMMIHSELARIYSQKSNLNFCKGHALMAADIAHAARWGKKLDSIINEFSLQKFNKKNESEEIDSTAVSVNNQKYTDSLMKVSLAMSSTLDPIQQARIALDQMIELLNAERAFLFSYEKDKNILKVKSGRNDKGEDLANLEGFSNTIMAKVLKERKPITLVADDAGEFSQAESIVAKGLKSIMAVPLFFKDQFVGVAYFDSQVAKGLFTKEDFEICKGICSHISIAQEVAANARIHADKAAYEKDLVLTATVQSMFFPESSHYQEKNINLNGIYKASTLCSGDWWWYAKSLEGKLRVFALDVTGHGAPSAMVTAILATIIRNDISNGVFQTSSVPEFLKKLNQKLFSMIEGKYCTTVTVFEIDQQTGKVDMWSAASPPLVVLSQDGGKNIIEAAGELIGYEDKDIEFGHMDYQMKDGDRLHVFSDGLVELPVKTGINYSFRKLIQILNKNMKSSSVDALQSILTEVDGYVGDPSKVDDITLILVDYKAS